MAKLTTDKIKEWIESTINNSNIIVGNPKIVSKRTYKASELKKIDENNLISFKGLVMPQFYPVKVTYRGFNVKINVDANNCFEGNLHILSDDETIVSVGLEWKNDDTINNKVNNKVFGAIFNTAHTNDLTKEGTLHKEESCNCGGNCGGNCQCGHCDDDDDDDDDLDYEKTNEKTNAILSQINTAQINIDIEWTDDVSGSHVCKTTHLSLNKNQAHNYIRAWITGKNYEEALGDWCNGTDEIKNLFKTEFPNGNAYQIYPMNMLVNGYPIDYTI